MDPAANFFIWVEDETLDCRSVSGEERMLASGAAALLIAAGLLRMLSHLCFCMSPKEHWMQTGLHCCTALTRCVNLEFDVA